MTVTVLFFLRWRGEGRSHCPQTKEAQGAMVLFHLLQVASLWSQRGYEKTSKERAKVIHPFLIMSFFLYLFEVYAIQKSHQGTTQTPRSINSLILSHPDSFVGYSSSFFCLYCFLLSPSYSSPFSFSILISYIYTHLLFHPVSVNKFLLINNLITIIYYFNRIIRLDLTSKFKKTFSLE